MDGGRTKLESFSWWILIIEICFCGRGTIITSSHPWSDAYLRDTDRSYIFLVLGRLGPKSKLCERWVVKSCALTSQPWAMPDGMLWYI